MLHNEARKLLVEAYEQMNTPANTTILSSVRLNGETAYTIYSGGMTREKFLDYLKNTLIPTLHEGDIVIMDNMRTHHVKEVQTLLQRVGMKLLYLPAYSPDLNPIEKQCMRQWMRPLPWMPWRFLPRTGIRNIPKFPVPGGLLRRAYARLTWPHLDTRQLCC